MQSILFYIIAVIMLVACWRVATTKNLIHTVLAAFVVLMSTAAIFFMLNAEFLAVVQILIYAGAITIMVLFVVMLTSTGPRYEVTYDKKIKPTMYLSTLVVFGSLVFLILNIQWPTGTTVLQIDDVTGTLAKQIFLEYLLPFEVASILLLVALVGAVVLARRE